MNTETQHNVHTHNSTPFVGTQQAKDITAERNNSNILPYDIARLAEIFHGGHKTWERKKWLMSLIDREPVFERRDRYFQGRLERFQRALAMGKRYVEIRNQYKLSAEDAFFVRGYLDEYIPIALHELMFIPALESQSSDEQRARWLDDALNFRIIGCYAQTELGHGSNLSGLETTATLDKASDEWIINSPHVSSGKYWVGGLGKLGTHAIVQAKLIIDGRDYGTHAFFVPIRSLTDHTTFPGLEIHDIGPKVGNNPIDSGFALFTNYRIPRDHMLMRYARVSRQGVYHKPLHDKLVYGTLTKVRVDLVEQSAVSLSRAMMIAIRYSAVRRQGSIKLPKDSGAVVLEQQILDYPSVQYRLLPLLALTWALTFTAEWMREMYAKLMEGLAEGNVRMLADVHAYSSGLKSYATSVVADGIEDARKCMGGHGYSMFSGIPDFYHTFQASNTVEGENWLLTQQTARHLLKLYAQTLRDPTSTLHLSATTIYLASLANLDHFNTKRCQAHTAIDLLDPAIQLSILAHNASRLVSDLAALQSATPTPTPTTSDLNIECSRVSRAHCQHILALNFSTRLTAARTSRELTAPALETLTDLSSLHALHCIEQNLGEHLESGYLVPAQAPLVRQAVRILLARIRPHAVTLVDSFGWPDAFLNSALGSYDGRAYERLVEWLKDEPLNTEVGMDEKGVVRGYEEYIKPLVRGECGRWIEEKTNEIRAKL